MAEVVKFKNQDYKSLFKSLTREGAKFEDPTFPASPSSLRAGSTNSDVEWLRPTELSPKPRLVIDGLQGGDVMQGERGNAWFVTASAAVTTRQQHFGCVLPDWRRQEYTNAFHPGIFCFRFQRMGRVYEVVIDDRLPTKKGRLLYCQSGDSDEFWSSLLEKAYAKLHGDYHCLQYGRCVDAVSAFVRGLPEHWDLSQVRAEVNVQDAATQSRIWKLIKSYQGRGSILLFSLQPTGKTRLGDWTPENLVVGRGYILCDARQLELKDGSFVQLLKMQNSWNDLEWKGAWCDGAPEWQTLSLKTKETFKYKFEQDGMFWMTISDVLKTFTHIDICITVTGPASSSWTVHSVSDEWNVTVRRQRQVKTAGGSYDYPDSYVLNPQYLMRITGDSKQIVSLCLEQGEVSAACNPQQLLPIGLDVFRVEENRACRLKEPPDESWFIARVEPQALPNVFVGALFRPGAYVLVPCTERPHCEQKFTLRAAGQQGFQFSELTADVPSQGSCCLLCYWSRVAVTRLCVTKVTGVGAYLKRHDARVMVRVSCEGSDVIDHESSYCPGEAGDHNSHLIDFRLLLYRHKLKEPIEVDVFYNSNSSLIKRFIGQTRITDASCHSPTEKQVPLYDNDLEIPVKIICSLQISGDITYF